MENKKKYTSNYDKLCENWRARFLTWDHQRIYQSLGLKGYQEQNLELIYFGRKYLINRETGMITRASAPNEVLAFSTQMSLYHLLYYSKEHPVNAGVWVPFREVKGAAPFDSAFAQLILKPLAKTFTGHLDELKKKGIELGFQEASYGDISFYIEAFPCIPMILIFWDGDDEFEAQANLLFDQNITDFTHEETVVMMAEDLLALFQESFT